MGSFGECWGLGVLGFFRVLGFGGFSGVSLSLLNVDTCLRGEVNKLDAKSCDSVSSLRGRYDRVGFLGFGFGQA